MWKSEAPHECKRPQLWGARHGQVQHALVTWITFTLVHWPPLFEERHWIHPSYCLHQIQQPYFRVNTTPSLVQPKKQTPPWAWLPSGQVSHIPWAVIVCNQMKNLALVPVNFRGIGVCPSSPPLRYRGSLASVLQEALHSLSSLRSENSVILACFPPSHGCTCPTEAPSKFSLQHEASPLISILWVSCLSWRLFFFQTSPSVGLGPHCCCCLLQAGRPHTPVPTASPATEGSALLAKEINVTAQQRGKPPQWGFSGWKFFTVTWAWEGCSLMIPKSNSLGRWQSWEAAPPQSLLNFLLLKKKREEK